MRERLDLEVLVQMHAEWKEGLLASKDYAEFLAKYGLGVKDELAMTVVHPDVTRRVQAMVNLVSSKASWDASELLDHLSQIWSTQQ